LKNNGLVQIKSCWKTYTESEQKSSDMGTDCNKRKMDELLLQSKIVYQKKQQQIKNGICSSAGSISECCFVKYFAEKRIKKI
jgi:hypothetical protein